MAPTVEYREERFNTFNRMCFDGALPRIPIKLSNARGFVGRLQYRPVRDWRGRVVRHEDFVLRISRHFDLTEAEVEDTLIHEMIHLWIAVNGIRDSSTHGRAFQRQVRQPGSLVQPLPALPHRQAFPGGAGRAQEAHE